MRRDEYEDDDAVDRAVEVTDRALDREADPRGMAIVTILLDRLEEWSADDFVGLPNGIELEDTPFDGACFGMKEMTAMVAPDDERMSFVVCDVQARPPGLRWRVSVRRCSGPFLPWPPRYPPDDDLAVAETILAAMHHACGRREPLRERPGPLRTSRAPVRPGRGPGDRVYRVKVTLSGTEPPLWRRLLVPGRMGLDRLHRALQGAMGWEEWHAHVFEAGGLRYSDPGFGFGGGGGEVGDEGRTDFETATGGGELPLYYDYDLGAPWEHRLEVEGIAAPAEVPPELPACVDGRRCGPPEDIGGPEGYRRFLETYTPTWIPRADGLGPWLEPGFDPDDFRPAIVDGWLRLGMR